MAALCEKRAELIGQALGCRFDGNRGKMGIARRRLDVVVAQQLAQHRQSFAEGEAG